MLVCSQRFDMHCCSYCMVRNCAQHYWHVETSHVSQEFGAQHRLCRAAAHATLSRPLIMVKYKCITIVILSSFRQFGPAICQACAHAAVIQCAASTAIIRRPRCEQKFVETNVLHVY